ncbi:hypothetical protein HDU76_009431, partial [Blyttiomyces sp. JEL0837]
DVLAEISIGILVVILEALKKVDGYDGSPVYIQSWNDESLGGACLLLNGLTISVPASCDETHPVLYQQPFIKPYPCKKIKISTNEEFKYCPRPVSWKKANEFGSSLAAVTITNIAQIEAALVKEGLSKDSQVYVGSWNGDNYEGAFLTLVGE